jgi:diaminohydroxyphosphoribosylaminopyrimidine deaminase/5-amino-6-(5-phosphoribosylamino)uracil reductase
MGFEGGPQPLAVIVTDHLPVPGVDGDIGFIVLQQRPEQTVFFTGEATAGSAAARRLEKLGCRVWPLEPVPCSESGQAGLDVAAGLRRLRAEAGCLYVVCEGGGALGRYLLERGLVGEFRLHLAPKIMADEQAAPLFSGRCPLTMEEVLGMRIGRLEQVGEDAHITLLRALSPGLNVFVDHTVSTVG